MKRDPTILPPVVATDVALVRLPVRIHTRLARIRPPSSGAAGSRLNSARAPLTIARYMAMPVITFSKGSWSLPNARAPKTRAAITLTAGPAAAIRSSSPAVVGSRRSRATPPSSQRVMPSTSMPARRATTEWPSSWARIDPKNSRTDSTEMTPRRDRMDVGVESGVEAVGQRPREQGGDREQAPVESNRDPEDPTE